MHPIQIIKRPMITEKCTWEGEARNRYSFEVILSADKQQIRDAIAALYNVRVESVATQVRKGKQRRTRYGMSKAGDWKKATVQLHKDDKIEMF